MNACSPACGWCGRCEDDIRESPPRQFYQCDRCGKDAVYPVTLAGVGICCSRACMNQLEAQYAARMQARHA